MPHPHASDHTHEPTAGSEALRGHGRRITRQRTLIWDELVAESDRHLSAEEIVERTKAKLPSLNPSTVYRTLELLVDEGLVLRTDFGGDRAYYEPAHEHPHHHIVCESCGTVVHLHDDVLGNLAERVEASSGYVLGSAEVTLFGFCGGCCSTP